MSTVAQYQTDMQAVRTAIGNADYDTARIELAKAQASLAQLPDSDSADKKVQWQRDINSLSGLIDQLQESSSTGFSIQRIPEYMQNVDGTIDYD